MSGGWGSRAEKWICIAGIIFVGGQVAGAVAWLFATWGPW